MVEKLASRGKIEKGLLLKETEKKKLINLPTLIISRNDISNLVVSSFGFFFGASIDI